MKKLRRLARAQFHSTQPTPFSSGVFGDIIAKDEQGDDEALGTARLGESTEQLPKNILTDGDEVVTAVIAGSSQVGEDLDIGFSLLTEHS